ncbi:MAG: hypothetical protein JST82_01935 [Bacteroidetes bacterium]|nr:hypothetical protein [Bacteroidota bacterium]
MELGTVWFPINESKTDAQNVYSFLENVSSNFRQLFNSETSNYLEVIGEESMLFENAYWDAEQQLKINLSVFEESNGDYRFGASENLYFYYRYFFPHPYFSLSRILKNIGFTGSSLRLKANLLNALWNEIVSVVSNSKVIDFLDKTIVKLVLKFLNYLNSIFDSLKIAFPGLDLLKELKEYIENTIE